MALLWRVSGVRSASSWGLLLAVMLGTWAGTAYGQMQVDALARRLRDPSFQVRVQAALSLGASDSSQAVAPLCSALDDRDAIVRAAAAAALGRLRRTDGLTCLRQRLAKESNGSVRSQLARAVRRLEQDQALLPDARACRPPTRASRWYVAVDEASNKTSRPRRDVDLVVQAAMRRKLLAEPKAAIAPCGEDKEVFRRIAKGNKVRGFLLRPSVEAISYEGNSLSVALRVTLFSYPDMALQGELVPTMSMSGISAPDTDAEDKLLQMAAERAVDSFLASTR